MTGDRTGIIVPPPVLFAGPFLVGWLIGRRWPWPLLDDRAFGILLGLAFISAGIAIAVSGVRQFRHARTTILPFGGTSQIVETGVYRWTRNPMYLGMALAYAGGAAIVNSVWGLVFLPVALALVHVFAIRHEERYLAAKFGDSYERYRTRVRRWI